MWGSVGCQSVVPFMEATVCAESTFGMYYCTDE